MCPSRWSLLVSIEVASIVTVTEESAGVGAGDDLAAEALRSCPRTLLTIMCRTVKETSECTGSMSQVPAR